MSYRAVLAAFDPGDRLRINDRDEMEVTFVSGQPPNVEVSLAHWHDADQQYVVYTDRDKISLHTVEADGETFAEPVETLHLVAEP